MLKSLVRRGKNKKMKKKSGSDGSLSNLCDKGDTSSGLGDSRNSSKASLAASDDDMLVDATPIKYDDEEVDASGSRSTVIEAESLHDVFTRNHADEDRLFRSEFENIPKAVTSRHCSCDYARRPENKEKNRYRNVITCDDSRVKLSQVDDDIYSDYINASYIDSYNEAKKFIAAQGPKENTLNNFWRMIWEKKCYVIVMITELRELGRYVARSLPSPLKLPGQKKCEKYWPEDGSVEFGKIDVRLQSVFEYGGFTKRLLEIKHLDQTEEQPRIITQFQYRAWPDHGVPKTTSEIFRFRLRTLEAQPEDCDAGPIVVHCSAGVGRTGTYIALDASLGQLKEEKKIDIFSLIVEFRTKRTEMVQSLDQYVLLHKLLTEYQLFGETDVTSEEFDEEYNKLAKVDEETNDSGFDSQFEQLNKAYPVNKRVGSGLLAANQGKNRDKDVVSYDHSRVFVRMRPSEQTPLYYNASNLEAYDVNTNLIASQGPMETTVEDFWRVVTDNYVSCVVMLSPLRQEDEEHCFQYWPDEGVLEAGEISVKTESSVSHDHFIENHFAVTNDQTTAKVVQLRYHAWNEEDNPPPQVGAALLEMASFVAEQLNHLRNNVKPRVLVHCSDGSGRTGVFCAIINLLERLKRENRVDVFRAVKDLRDCRPLMVRSKQQYKLCYDVIREHLSKENDVTEEGNKL